MRTLMPNFRDPAEELRMQILPVIGSRVVAFHRDAVGVRLSIVRDAVHLPRDLEDASIFGSHLTTAENGRKIGSESFCKCEKDPVDGSGFYAITGI
jgi:hypothetical protein